jgi:hypothetical protein
VIDLKKDCENDILRLETEISSIQSVMKQDESDQNIKLVEELSNLQADLHHTRALKLKYSQSFFRVPFGSGIVGGVAVSGESTNVSDLQPSDLFEFEKIRSGRLKTRSILCNCAYDTHGELVGVIEAINRKHFSFQKVGCCNIIIL